MTRLIVICASVVALLVIAVAAAAWRHRRAERVNSLGRGA